ncbi:MAG: hypothetical protein QM679_11310 [Patulibacter sp.]
MRRSTVPLVTCMVVLLASVATPRGVAVAAASAKVTCKAGTIPKVTGAGKQAKLATKRGKAVCVKTPKVKPSQIEPAATTSQGTIASTTDQLTQALAVNPDALARIERKLGKHATDELVERAMNGWRTGARASTARRLADDGGFHYTGSFGDAGKGTSGSARLDTAPAGDGGQGIKASAAIEFGADAKGLKELGADKLTSAKSAKVKIEIAFEDAPAACPTAAGKVAGVLNASATLTITTDGATQTMAAKVNSSYSLTVGPDARWKTIDDVNVKTEFSFGGSGQKTETWRGERGGAGFGQRGIFGDGSGDFSSAVAEQQSHINPNIGGVWGPRGRVLFSDPSTDNIFNYGGSIAHLKGMIMTDIATTYLTYAAVEYIRHVVAPRGDKHWHDAEGCLQLTATPDKSKLGPGETAVITASDAKAADGASASATITASGVASITPGAASLGAGGKSDFTLTAPSRSPVVATYTLVALSPAGKKTISGTLKDQPVYTVTFEDDERAEYATHLATGHLAGTLTTVAVDGAAPAQSTGSGQAFWSDVSATALIENSWLENPVYGTADWSATVTSNDDTTVNVKLDVAGNARVLWTFSNDEPADPYGNDPPRVDTPGTVGTITIALWNTPLDFDVPADGGTYRFDQEFTTGDGGTFSAGAVTVIPGAQG